MLTTSKQIKLVKGGVIKYSLIEWDTTRLSGFLLSWSLSASWAKYFLSGFHSVNKLKVFFRESRLQSISFALQVDIFFVGVYLKHVNNYFFSHFPVYVIFNRLPINVHLLYFFMRENCKKMKRCTTYNQCYLQQNLIDTIKKSNTCEKNNLVRGWWKNSSWKVRGLAASYFSHT